jgi:hypothetical protein
VVLGSRISLANSNGSPGAGQTKHLVRFWSPQPRDDAALQQARFLDGLGLWRTVTVDTCILTSPMLPPDVKYLMTNSAKFAYYAPGMLGRKITFGSLKDCVASAVEGRVIRDESLWTT